MHRLLSLAFRQVISQSYSYQTKASVSTNVARALVMSEHGFPENALKLREHPIPPEGSLKSDEVLINVLAVRSVLGSVLSLALSVFLLLAVENMHQLYRNVMGILHPCITI